jgi:hypothetical protein
MAGEPRNKTELMARIASAWAELQRLLDALSPEDMERPLGDWTPKQQLGHISVWEASLVALLRGESRAAAMGAPLDAWERHDTDAINAQVAERSKRWPLDNVLKRAEEIHGEVVAQLEAMSDADLQRPYSHYQPEDGERAGDGADRPVVGWVNGNTWLHYEEHVATLRAALAE